MIDYTNVLKSACEYAKKGLALPFSEDVRSFFDIFCRSIHGSSKDHIEKHTGFNATLEPKALNPQILVHLALGAINGDYKLQKELLEDEKLQISKTIRDAYEPVKGYNLAPVLREELKYVPMRPLQFYEVLSKKVVRVSMPEGAKVYHLDQDRVLTTYVCEKIIHKEGLKAYFFKSLNESRASFLLFRPTVRTYVDEGLKSFMEDCHDQIGITGYTEAYAEFESLFATLDQKIHLVGFSLGGVHAARTQADFPSHVSKAYYFNDPATEEAVNEKFLSYMQTHPNETVELHIVHHAKDPISWLGQMHIGYKPKEARDSLRHLKVRFYQVGIFDDKAYAAGLKKSFLGKRLQLLEYMNYHTHVQIAPVLRRFYKSLVQEIDMAADRTLLYYKNRPKDTRWFEEKRQSLAYLRYSLSILAHTIHRVIEKALEVPSLVSESLDRMILWIQKQTRIILTHIISQLVRIASIFNKLSYQLLKN